LDLSVIIGRLVTLVAQRLCATCLAVWVLAIASMNVVADAIPDSTWVALKPVPHQGHSALFALAVDPSNNQSLLAGTSDGSLMRSANGGTSWVTAHKVKSPYWTISFSPYNVGLVLAGTRGSGGLISRDGGVSWSAVTGLDGRSVRSFAFALTLVAAATDHGVYLSQDGAGWTQSSLNNRSINAIAVEAIHAPVRLVAGGDSQGSGGVLPLFQSVDSGTTWTQFNPPISGTIMVKLAAGPLPPTGNVRPLMAGTNTGLFLSTDNAATFTPLSGGGLLPSTDYTQVTFIADHSDRFYVSSDGGASSSGGLWRTNDLGQTFTSLQPPQASVTALAISSNEDPTLYVATVRPSDLTPSLWVYHDTGGTPQGPAETPTTASSGARINGVGSGSSIGQLLATPELPYIGLGVAALALIVTAVVAHLRGRRR
jgi:photosystem II stability/assembly factor-like uncharacterized protein